MRRACEMTALVLSTVCVTALWQVVRAQAPPNPERLLAPADVEKVSGAKGIVRKKMASGGLNFVRQADGSTLLRVNFSFAADFAAQRKAVGKTQPVPGVGEEAVSFGDGLSLVFRKGRYAVQLTSGLNPQNVKPFFTPDQLRQLAKVMASRL